MLSIYTDGKKQKCIYDYYDVVVPGDVFDGDDALNQLAHLAIDEAAERTRLYCIPAVWTAKHVSGEVGDWEVRFRVCRKRRRPTAVTQQATEDAFKAAAS